MSTIIRRLLFALPVVVVGWLPVMAMVMRFSDVAPGSAVLFPS